MMPKSLIKILLLLSIPLLCHACSSHQKYQEDESIAELSSLKQNKKYGLNHQEDRHESDAQVDSQDEVRVEPQMVHLPQELSKANPEQIEKLKNQDQVLKIQFNFERDQQIQTKIQCTIRAHSSLLLSMFSNHDDRYEMQISRLFPRLMIEISNTQHVTQEINHLESVSLQMKPGDLYFDTEDQHLHLLEKPMPWHLDQLVYLGHCYPLSSITYLNRQPIDVGHIPVTPWTVILEGLEIQNQ
jgi:hypothetical protein